MALVGESGGTISANQLRQALGVQYKTAWQLGNRLREAMQQSVHETIQERVEARESAAGLERSHRNEPALWERQIFLRFLEGAGRSGAGPLAAPRDAALAGNEMAARSGIAQIGTAMRRPEKAPTRLNGSLAGIQDPLARMWGLWKRGVIDSFPVVGARHIPGYMNEVTYLFGRLFISALPRELLCPIGQELKRTVEAQPAGTKGGR